MPMPKQWDRVADERGNKGTVTLVYGNECCIAWDNGMTGSFSIQELQQSRIKVVGA